MVRFSLEKLAIAWASTLLVLGACTAPDGSREPRAGTSQTLGNEIPGITFETVRGGRFVGAVNDGGGAVIATATVALAWETFTLVDVNGGSLVSGDSVFVRAGNGQYFQAVNGGGSTLDAASYSTLQWETFRVVKQTGTGAIHSGDIVGLQDSNGTWVSAQNGGGGPVFAYGPALGPWEELTIGGLPPGGAPSQPSTIGNAHFRTVLQSRFIGAQNNGGGAVTATATVAQAWETFSLLDINGGSLQSGDPVFVQAGNGQFFQALNGGGSTLNAASNNKSAWETFTIVRQAGPGAMQSGDIIGLQDSSGTWVSAQNGGGGPVFAYGPAMGPWESFVFTTGNGPVSNPPPPPPPPPPPAPPSPPKLYPDHGALLGAFVGTGPVADYESLIGRSIALDLQYYDWTSDIFGGGVPDDIAHGRIPYSTWQPNTGPAGVPLDDIINGVHDALIRQRAAEAKALQVPLLLRWAHEMNGNWYPWSGALNGGAAGGPAKYVAAYRHIHDVFAGVGASNVQWVWCPINADVPYESWNHWSAYYPGDSYVDWIGFDGYNWGSTQAWGWQSFQSIFQQIYAEEAGLGKPLIIGETASTEFGGNKADWITGMLSASAGAFPALKAIVWFEINKETDWRVESSPASLAAFKQVAHDPYFHP